MERASPGDSRFCPRSLEASRSKSASSRCRRMKDLTLKFNLWFDLRCFGFRPPPKPPDFSRRSSIGTVQVTVPSLIGGHSGGAQVCFTAVDCDFVGQFIIVAPLCFVVETMKPIYVVCLD
ncbi:hypothetical protein V6N13_114901 [Hibiscus sabdariffa]